jgi:hypothetical protein
MIKLEIYILSHLKTLHVVSNIFGLRPSITKLAHSARKYKQIYTYIRTKLFKVMQKLY